MMTRISPAFPNSPRILSAVLAALAMVAVTPARSGAQGMPAEARGNIHTLFNSHERITRSVTMTPDGYSAVTESDDPQVAAALKAHVTQMGERLKSGLMVRHWDPAFAEYVKMYSEIDHKFEATDKGVRMVVQGRTADAVKVARNHANVVSDFASNGWTAHDRNHAAVLATDSPPTSAPPPAAKGCCGPCKQ